MSENCRSESGRHGRWVVMGSEGTMLYAHCGYDCGFEIQAKTSEVLRKKILKSRSGKA